MTGPATLIKGDPEARQKPTILAGSHFQAVLPLIASCSRAPPSRRPIPPFGGSAAHLDADARTSRPNELARTARPRHVIWTKEAVRYSYPADNPWLLIIPKNIHRCRTPADRSVPGRTTEVSGPHRIKWISQSSDLDVSRYRDRHCTEEPKPARTAISPTLRSKVPGTQVQRQATDQAGKEES